MSEGAYLSIEEVAALIRKMPKTVRNMMSRGVFLEDVHYFRPRRSTPLFRRQAVIKWVEGREPAPPVPTKRGKARCSVDLSLIPR